MAATQMTASRLLVPSTGISTRRSSRPARAVRVFASTQERQGPKDVVLKTLSAIAAAQLAVLPISGAAMAVELPSKAQAEASDQKTDNLPSFKDIGASLNKQFGQTDPKDVGKAIDQNTPDVNLEKNPKDLAKDAGKAVRNAAGDLSEAPSPYDTAREQRTEANSYGSGDSSQNGIPKSLQGNPGQSAVGKGGNVGPNVGSNDNQRRTPNLARDLLSELADLPNPFSGNPANEAASKAQRAAEDVGKKLPSGGDAASALKNNVPALPKVGGGGALPGSGQGKGDLFKSRNL